MLNPQGNVGGGEMETGTSLVSALVLTYFVSRLTLRLPNPASKARGIALAHGLSLAAILVLLFLVRGSANAFAPDHLLTYIAPQVLWWLLDVIRQHGLKGLAIGRRSG